MHTHARTDTDTNRQTDRQTLCNVSLSGCWLMDDRGRVAGDLGRGWDGLQQLVHTHQLLVFDGGLSLNHAGARVWT